MQRRAVVGLTPILSVDPESLRDSPAISSSCSSSSSAAMQKKRRKAAQLSFQNRCSRLMEEDGVFICMVGCAGLVLLVLITAVSYKLAVVILGGPPSLQRQRQRQKHGVQDDDVAVQAHEVLPFNPIYRIPEALETVGDRSNAYAKLRLQFDQDILPFNHDRSLAFVQSLPYSMPGVKPFDDAHHSDQVDSTMAQSLMAYDIYNCPHTPPPGYPYQWNLVNQILKNWPADQTDPVPDQIFQSLCIFDYNKDYAKALNYRNKEMPFVVTNDPEVARTVERWHQPNYVEKMVGPNVNHRTEYNKNAHFLYHMPEMPGNHKRFDPKTVKDLRGRKAELQNKAAIPEQLRMTFGDWLRHANVTKNVGPNDEHWYYRLIGCGYMGSDGTCDSGSTEALFDELPFFQPKPGLYIGDPDEQKGIHCRFGMKGVIAENHFDGSRNAIVLLAGRRRYILAHPNQCPNLALLPMQHPSARHSAVDYTNPNVTLYPEFLQAQSNEVVLQPGQVLYLPTNWFHFIVSLDLNYQCNTRSGISSHYIKPIRDCGF